MAKNSERFQKIYTQGVISMIEIWVDTTTGVQYLFHKDGYAAGLTPLLEAFTVLCHSISSLLIDLPKFVKSIV